MRTTLTIDDDVPSALPAKADFQKRSIGEVVCDLIRACFDTPNKTECRNRRPIINSGPNRVPLTFLRQTRSLMFICWDWLYTKVSDLRHWTERLHQRLSSLQRKPSS